MNLVLYAIPFFVLAILFELFYGWYRKRNTYRLNDSLSVSGRLNYTWEDEIEGQYNGPHGHVAPPHFQENYGGHILEGGVGLNWVFRGGFLKGHRLATEVLVPMYQDLNGVGMNRDYSVIVGWQKAF